jgi:hypothetical protein
MINRGRWRPPQQLKTEIRLPESMHDLVVGEVQAKLGCKAQESGYSVLDEGQLPLRVVGNDATPNPVKVLLSSRQHRGLSIPKETCRTPLDSMLCNEQCQKGF